VNQNIEFVHCAIHREALAAKEMPEDLKNVLQTSVKLVNYMKRSAKNCRIFKELCEELGSDYLGLLYFTEVRWLSKGKCLTRLFCLKTEVISFLNSRTKLTDEMKIIQNSFKNNDFLAKLAYLADILSILNELNISMQGRSNNIFEIFAKVDGLKRRFNFFLDNIDKNDLSMFPYLSVFITANNVNTEVLKISIISHINMLKIKFNHYFKDIDRTWIANPFSYNEQNLPADLNTLQKDKLLDISCNFVLKGQFECKDLFQFWVDLNENYPCLSQIATKKLLTFPTTYLCEQAFSHVFFLKNDLRNCLELEPVIRVRLTTQDIDIKSIVEKEQSHPSHH
jgi:hypothetical protein